MNLIESFKLSEKLSETLVFALTQSGSAYFQELSLEIQAG